MSGVKGITAAKTSIGAVLAFVKEAGRLSRDGVQITDGISLATNKELIGKAMAAFAVRNEVQLEFKDIDAVDAKDLFFFLVTELSEVFDAFGLEAVKEYMMLLPEIAELGEINYLRGKKIYERFEALRKPRADVE